MTGRFPIYADADVRGPLLKALKKAGGDVVRAIDLYPERTLDLTHFECAVAMGRILLTNDEDQEQTADQVPRRPALSRGRRLASEAVRPDDIRCAGRVLHPKPTR